MDSFWDQPPATPLGALFAAHGSDKYMHGYDILYQHLFPDQQAVGAVLEVGIGTRNPDGTDHTVHPWFPDDYQPGASLRAWSDWFPRAMITGMDPEPDCMITGYIGICTVLCDSTDSEAVHDALGGSRFNLIVDDGNHEPWAQLATLRNLWPHLLDGGVYVIEDVKAIYIQDVTSIVGFDSWKTARFIPSQSCAEGFGAFAIAKGGLG